MLPPLLYNFSNLFKIEMLVLSVQKRISTPLKECGIKSLNLQSFTLEKNELKLSDFLNSYGQFYGLPTSEQVPQLPRGLTYY